MYDNILEIKDYNPEELLKKFDLFKAPINLIKLCKEIGIPVTHGASLKKLYSGEISVDSDGDVNIWVNSMDHYNRQRFTLAHELGHLVNDIIPHIEEHKEIVFTDPATNFKRSGAAAIEEYEANEFAANLLMPKSLVVKEGKKIIKFLKNKSSRGKVSKSSFIEKMSEKFGVSEQAMEIRLKIVGII